MHPRARKKAAGRQQKSDASAIEHRLERGQLRIQRKKRKRMLFIVVYVVHRHYYIIDFILYAIDLAGKLLLLCSDNNEPQRTFLACCLLYIFI